MIYIISAVIDLVSPIFLVIITLIVFLAVIVSLVYSNVAKLKKKQEILLAKSMCIELLDIIQSNKWYELEHNKELDRSAVVSFTINYKNSLLNITNAIEQIEGYENKDINKLRNKEIKGLLENINDVINHESKQIIKLNDQYESILSGEISIALLPKQDEEIVERQVKKETKESNKEIEKSIAISSLQTINKKVEETKAIHSKPNLGLTDVNIKAIALKNINHVHKKRGTKMANELETNSQSIEKTEDNKVISILETGVVIDGCISIDSSAVIKGTINGNIVCNKDLEFDGSAVINGDISARSINLLNCKVEGDITVEKGIYVETDVFVKGNIKAESLVINGCIDGDIIAEKEVSLSDVSKVLGNVMADYIDIETGAKVSGNMKIGSNSDKKEIDEKNKSETFK